MTRTAIALATIAVGALADGASAQQVSCATYDPRDRGEVMECPQRVSRHVASIQVPEIFRATSPANPWPRVLSPRELRGLARESYRAHLTLYPRDRRAHRGVCRNLYGAPHCVVVRRDGMAVRGLRVLRLYEDGSGRVRFFVPDMD